MIRPTIRRPGDRPYGPGVKMRRPSVTESDAAIGGRSTWFSSSTFDVLLLWVGLRSSSGRTGLRPPKYALPVRESRRILAGLGFVAFLGTFLTMVGPGAIGAAVSAQRIYGTDAIGTSIAVSQAEFPSAGSAQAVVLARSDFFSDALAGGPLAAKLGGPLLITPGASLSSSLDPRVQAEIQRVLPVGDTVYILGGDLALSPNIDTDLKGLGYVVIREAGSDEYATAVDIAEALGNPSTILEATGLSFYDALSAVPAAIEDHAAILLTDGSTQAPETAAYLAQFSGDTRIAIGGPLAAFGADPTATPVYGQDLFATSAAVASYFFPSAAIFGAATAAEFPDALGGGVFMATGGRMGPLLLVNQSTPLPPEILPYLATLTIGTSGYVFGGPLAVNAAVLTALQASVGASPGCAEPIATWSVDQLVNQLLMVSGQFADPAASASPAGSGVGAFVFFGQPSAGSGPAITSGLAALQADASANGQVAPWMATDEEGGEVARLSNVIGSLPTPRQMAAEWSPSQVETALAAHGSAMRSLGITMDLAPVLDTASPTDTIDDENDRSFSEDGQVAASYGDAFADGLESAGVVPVAKHFPGLGHANADTDLGPATVPPLSQLETDDLIPFESAISNGIPVVMVGHPIVPGLTNGLPASLSPATYTLLRQTLGFTGVALTDSLGAGAISAAGYSEQSAAVAAIEAGADMVIIDVGSWPATLGALESAVSSGALPLGAVESSVSRILAAKNIPICPA
jgi:beta-N-acetylhexosaminidase